MQESAAKSAVQMTLNEIQEIEAMIQDLKIRNAEHDEIQKRLDTLLESVFAGPSEAFPEEDHQESEVYALEKEYREVRLPCSANQMHAHLFVIPGRHKRKSTTSRKR